MPRRHVLARRLLGLGLALGAPAAIAQLRIEPDALPLKLQNAPVPRQNVDESRLPIFGSGDRMEGMPNEETRFIGNAEIRRADSVLKADRLTYFPVQDELFGFGNVVVDRGGNTFRGPELRLRFDTGRGYFVKPSYFFSETGGGGTADRVDFLDRENSLFRNATYSTCSPNDPDWFLLAREMRFDQGREVGEAESARIFFKGVSVLPIPYMTFPISNERRSGVLAPFYSYTSRTGLDVSVPYYINIAPNRDLTLYPRLMARRGLQLGGVARYLEPTFSGELRGEYLPDDTIRGIDRWSFMSRHNWVGTGGMQGLTGGWTLNGVSDNNYFVDFSRTIAVSSQRVLPRDVFLSYAPSWWNITGRATRFQTLQDARAPIAPPYDRLPQIVLRGNRYDRNGFDFSVLGDLSVFSYPLERTIAGGEVTDGARLVFNPSVAYPVQRPGWFVTPRASLHATSYALDRTATGIPRHLDRVLPTLSVDSGLVFERPSRFLGVSATQTLEPRLFYVYTPYRDQSQFPLFDTANADFNFAQLFAENTFIGHDRIANLNQVTAAAITRFIAQDDGREMFRFALGQRYYLADERVTLPGFTPRTSTFSDMLFGMTGFLPGGHQFDMTTTYNPEFERFQRLNLLYRFIPGPRKVFNASYRMTYKQLEQIDLSTQWPLSSRWYLVARANYSLFRSQVTAGSTVTLPRGPIETLAGLEYDGDCWVARFVAQRFLTAAGTSTSALFFQIELGGLGRLGTNPLTALRRNIPGYQLLTPAGGARAPQDDDYLQ